MNVNTFVPVEPHVSGASCFSVGGVNHKAERSSCSGRGADFFVLQQAGPCHRDDLSLEGEPTADLRQRAQRFD